MIALQLLPAVPVPLKSILQLFNEFPLINTLVLGWMTSKKHLHERSPQKQNCHSFIAIRRVCASSRTCFSRPFLSAMDDGDVIHMRSPASPREPLDAVHRSVLRLEIFFFIVCESRVSFIGSEERTAENLFMFL